MGATVPPARRARQPPAVPLSSVVALKSPLCIAIMGSSPSAPIETPEWRAQFVAPAGVDFREELDASFTAATALPRKTNIVSWLPSPSSGVAVRGVVLIAHGLHEHSLRYHAVGCAWAAEGWAVYSVDHVGHGLTRFDAPSENVPGLIPSREVVCDDFVHFAALVRARHAAETPVFLMGHSLGSLISLCAAGRIPKLRALALSGCAVIPGEGSASPFGCACLYPVTQTDCGVCLTGVRMY
jgi:pimeloyl-ACP methyl ester carboxylesterase